MFFAKIHPAVPKEDLPPVRVYDLRHMFASTVIHKWLAEEAVLTNKLPFLQIYMGHKTLSETSYYVHLIPERLLTGKGIEWDHMNAMIPEVFYEES